MGYSRVAQRRVLPALQALGSIESIAIASRRGSPSRDDLPGKVEETYADFARALEQSDADWVYVSTVNSEHEQWARRALHAASHVMVDKPAFLSLEVALELVGYARDHELVLGEATVYTDHPQIAMCKKVFSEAQSRPTRISAVLSMPPLDEANFRYRKKFGGGALWDLGPYAVSVGRVFFGGRSTRLQGAINTRGGSDAVETSFSMLAQYADGCSVVGHFGFDTEYRNELLLLGEDVSVSFQRAFTIPPELENRLEIRVRDEETIGTAPAADPFAFFLERFVTSLAEPTGSGALQFSDDLVEGARMLGELRKSAGA